MDFSVMIKISMINQYLGSNIDWSELFSVVSSAHPCGEMLRLTGSVIKKKRQNTPKLVSQPLYIDSDCFFETRKMEQC